MFDMYSVLVKRYLGKNRKEKCLEAEDHPD